MASAIRAGAERPGDRILMVEHDESLVEAIARSLERECYEVRVVRAEADVLAHIESFDPDVVIADVDGAWDEAVVLCRSVRAASRVAVILVASDMSALDAAAALDAGADDVIGRLHRHREITARVRAVLRRRPGSAPAPAPGDSVLRVGGLLVDRDRHVVVLDGRPMDLPLKEFSLLAVLAENADRVLTRERLMALVWGPDHLGDTKTLDVHIKRLRAKIEPDPANPQRIVTLRGLGYKFVPPR